MLYSQFQRRRALGFLVVVLFAVARVVLTSAGSLTASYSSALVSTAKTSSSVSPDRLRQNPSAPTTGNWTAVARMNTTRAFHTATLLSNGKVLVVGGAADSRIVDYLRTAELYDPVANTWTNTGSLVTGRELHTATMLPNGKVLVAGGVKFPNTDPLSSAELYDPVTGAWSSGANLINARWGHTATLLGNGKVLIAGGSAGSAGLLATAELYDPAANTWTSAASLATKRVRHVASLLPNGSLLVTAGHDEQFQSLASTELYNPSLNAWTSAEAIPNARYLPEAALLQNGKVLLTGGVNAGPLASTQLYDLSANTWINGGNLNHARVRFTATVLPNGRVLVTGGDGDNHATAIDDAELFDPATNTWAETAILNEGRFEHTATLLTTGRVLVAGGVGNKSFLASAELYDAASGSSDGPKIVFGSARNGGNHDIYAMDLNGSNQTRLTNNPAYDDQPRWSPDGNKIVFMSDRNGNFEVYSMNADGSSQTRLTNSPAADGFPSWSPDGTKIAFVSGDLRNPSTFEIYVMNSDGSNRTRLTNDALIDGVPAWSPDGTRIVFMSGGPSVFDPNSFEIFVMNADGSNRIRLTNNQVVDGQPSFSPDGTKILFGSGDAMNPNGIEIYVMNANGSNRTQLTNNSMTDGFPAWSPDGAKIIFASGNVFDETAVELFVMNADGSNRTQLTNNSALDWFADWQPLVMPPWQPVVLAANQIELKVWTLQGRTYAYVKPQFPNAGYRVVNWGQVGRSGNDFTVDASVERFIGYSIQAVVTIAQIYDLGPLADGTYNFNFKTSGTLAKALQFTVSSATPPPNLIDTAREFVKQQYRDFLNREADQAGEDFWTDNITKCSDPARRPAGQTEAQCTLRQRETTSGAFFLSPEFQYTGYFVYRIYQGGLGRQPKLSEFTPDAQFVGAGILVNSQLSAAKINQNKADFAAQFVNCTDATKYRCAEFKAIYDGLSNQQYVDKLFQTTGVTPTASERTALVNGLNAIPATETRASVLQKVVDGIVVISEGNQRFDTTYGQAFYNSESNRAFVQLQYFGYMKRDPDDAGYAFWLGKLNQFGGNFVNAEMVLAFISSPEYRARFGQP